MFSPFCATVLPSKQYFKFTDDAKNSSSHIHLFRHLRSSPFTYVSFTLESFLVHGFHAPIHTHSHAFTWVMDKDTSSLIGIAVNQKSETVCLYHVCGHDLRRHNLL